MIVYKIYAKTAKTNTIAAMTISFGAASKRRNIIIGTKTISAVYNIALARMFI
jgi:hypothetical protein